MNMDNTLNEAAGFRVGDEVELSNLPSPKIGWTGVVKTIVKIYDYSGSDNNFISYNYLFEFDGGRRYDENEIRHVKRVANNLNRKLYPSYVERGGYLHRR